MKKALSITYFNNRYFVLFGVFILAIMNFYLESSIMIFIFSCVYWFFLRRTKQEEKGKYHLSALGISENEWFLANYLKTIGLFFLLLGFYSMLDLMIPLKAPLFVEIFFQFLPYFFLLYLLEAFNIYSMQRNRRDIPSILILVMISAFYLIIVLSFLDKVFFPMEKYAMIITAYFIYLAFLFNFLFAYKKQKILPVKQSKNRIL